MREGKLPYDEESKYAGVKNSQVHGSNVIVYTMCDSPMEMIFMHPNPDEDVTQNTKHYIRHPCFSMKLGDGYVSVLDCLDDLMFTHEVEWEDLELCAAVTKDGVVDLRNRVAIVMRRCENMKDFYTDTETIRPDEDMLSAMKKSKAKTKLEEGMGRNIYE